MKLTNLKRASDYDVNNWLKKKLELTPYQYDKLTSEEIIRFGRYEFYEQAEKGKISIAWRLTIFLFPIYYLVLFIFLPFTMLFTGKWGYGQKFYDYFHAKWMRKLKL